MLGTTSWNNSHCSPSSNYGKRYSATLHIRKPSLSHSISSSRSSSTQSTRSAGTFCHDRVLDFDPLSLHPTFHPPPRLYERPYIHNLESTHHNAINSYFFSQEVTAAEEVEASSVAAAISDMPALPVDSRHTPLQEQARSQELTAEGDDYFLFKLQQYMNAARPQLPRSHWSESTVNTMTSVHEGDNDDDETEASRAKTGVVVEERPLRDSRWRNFSIKRISPSNARRPQMRSLDSVDDFIKRGGWKRRGIVFEQDGNRSSSVF